MNTRACRGEAGMAMLEAVIVLPVLMMLLFAILELGLALGRWQVLSNAAREGARRAVVYHPPGTCNASTVESEVDAAVTSYASVLGMSVTPGDVSLSGACAAGPATVSVAYTNQFLFLDRFAPGVASSLRLVGTSTMRNE
jgi:Flp pilus assembly protein TadG